MRSIRSKGTLPELRVAAAIDEDRFLGSLWWERHPESLLGRPDFAIRFTKRRIAIFVHGCFWHRCRRCKPRLPKTNRKFWKAKFEANVRRDRRVARGLRAEGWSVHVIWECQTRSRPAVMAKLSRAIGRIRATAGD